MCRFLNPGGVRGADLTVAGLGALVVAAVVFAVADSTLLGRLDAALCTLVLTLASGTLFWSTVFELSDACGRPPKLTVLEAHATSGRVSALMSRALWL